MVTLGCEILQLGEMVKSLNMSRYRMILVELVKSKDWLTDQSAGHGSCGSLVGTATAARGGFEDGRAFAIGAEDRGLRSCQDSCQSSQLKCQYEGFRV